VDLQVGAVEFGARADEGARLEHVLAPRPLAAQHVVEADGELPHALGDRIGGDGERAVPGEDDVEVVLQVLADAREGVHDGDAMPAQVLRIADARQLQDVGRLHRTR
jgi:hypothetical protein